MKSKIEKRSINFLPNAKLTAAGKTRDFFQMKNIWANECFECYVLVRSTISKVQLTLTPHWEVSNYVRASSSCGLMTLNVLLPTLTASPALRGPPPAQHQPEIIKLIKPDTAHTIHTCRGDTAENVATLCWGDVLWHQPPVGYCCCWECSTRKTI